ncbi:hypothetical protein L2E82_02717 [Cichorium intybus]|uniref:Uncharacterized protein n=1 Tax=Cichorium intybus TaxID=13427 RepID=A0ACB9H3R2_CICIN|nr:hypothetical protein L2E82_02717 [Cichorium intybus]
MCPEDKEEPQNVSQEVCRNNSTGVADQGGNSASISVASWISELEIMLKQKTFTRSEAQRLIALVHSRTMEESPHQPTTMESLPDELLGNIFIRLLAKQLAQMRSVSKSWNALLSQSSFVQSYVHRSNDDFFFVFLFQLL